MAKRIIAQGAVAPTHAAAKGTLFWDAVAFKLYVNKDGATAWQEIAGGAQVFVGAQLDQDNVPSAQAIPHDTVTALNLFDAPSWEKGTTMYDAEDKDRLTVITPGVYLVTGYVTWAASAVGIRSVSITKNGAQGHGEDLRNACATGQTVSPFSGELVLAATDYVGLKVKQTSGGDLDVVWAHMTMTYRGPSS